MTSTAAPLAGEIDQRLVDRRRGAGIDAPGRLRDHQHAGLAQDLAADDELLQVAAGEARASGSRRRAHVERLGDAVDRSRASRRGRRSRGDQAARRVAGEQRILGERHARHGAVAEALLGHEGRAEPAPSVMRHRPAPLPSITRLPASADRRSPESAANSSFWPLPATPAMPRISPARTSSDML